MGSLGSTATGDPRYTVNNARAFLAEFTLQVPAGGTRQIFIHFPTPASGLVVDLGGSAAALVLRVDTGAVAAAFGPYTIDSSIQDPDPDAINGRRLTCSITNPTGADLTANWHIRGRATNPIVWDVRQVENAPGALTIVSLVCEATNLAQLAPSVPSALDGASVTVQRDTTTANPALNTRMPAALTAPLSWFYPENAAIPAFAAYADSVTFSAPVVTAPLALSLRVRIRVVGANGNEFITDSNIQNVTLNPRARHMILVLDRSGSMNGAMGGGGQKWAAAVNAAHAWADLILAFRSGVAGVVEKFGVFVFEANPCGWSSTPAAPINLVVPPAGALGAVGNLNMPSAAFSTALGAPGSCTPIGDSLIKAIDRFVADIVPVPADDRFAIVLATDGYENSGTVGVEGGSPAPSLFSNVRDDGARLDIHNRLSIFTLGLGATVQEDVLDQLALEAGAGGGMYLLSTSTADMLPYFQAMLGSWVNAEEVLHTATVLTGAPAANVRYFLTSAKEQRLAVTLLWADPADDVILSYRPQTGGAWTVPGGAMTVRKRSGHGSVAVDLGAEFPAGVYPNGVPALEWSVDYRPVGSATPQPINPLTRLQVMVDLFVKADFTFDRESYVTGDAMTIRCRLVAGPAPIPGATVRTRLSRPGEGLGNFLATHAEDYQAGAPQPPDPAAPKLQMEQDLLRQEGLTELPRETPPNIFVGGGDALIEATAGVYANTFAGTDKEGTYTWRFLVEGGTPESGRFARIFTVSKWVGVNVDPITTPVVAQAEPPTAPPVSTSPPADPASGTTPNDPPKDEPKDPALPKGMLARTLVIRPRDRRGQLLGPFRPYLVRFTSTSGRFVGRIKSLADGRYIQTLHYPEGGLPLVTVRVQGKDFLPMAAAPGCLGMLINAFRALLLKLLRLGRDSKEKKT